MKEYWLKEYDKLCEGIVFKIKNIDPIELINLTTSATDFEHADWKARNELIKNTMRQIIWTKNKQDWFPLVEEDGSPRLPELRENPVLGFDLFFAVRTDVLTPVFIESKIFQGLMQGKKAQKSNKR